MRCHVAPERPPHTSLLVESDEANQCMGMMRRPFGKFGLHPYSFSKDILGFLMTTESQDFSLTSHTKDGAFYSIVSPSLYWGVRTHTDHRVRPPLWPHEHLIQQQPIFPRSLPSRYWPAQPCLASVGTGLELQGDMAADNEPGLLVNPKTLLVYSSLCTNYFHELLTWQPRLFL